MPQGANRRCTRWGLRHFIPRQRRGVESGNQTARGRLDVPLDPGDLTGEEQRRPTTHLPRWTEHTRSVDVRVAVYHPEPDELRRLEARNHPKDPRLLPPFQPRLEPHQAVVVPGQGVLSELHDRVGPPAGSRIGQPHRLHRPERERARPALRHHLDREAALEVARVLEGVRLDLARLDEEGWCYIVDRAKDMIIRGGENIYSSEVENVLYDHPAVTDAALIGIPHQTLGEEPAAVVHLAPGKSASEEELREWVAARLAKFKVPVRVAFVEDTLPRNANGKILKPVLREQFVS